MSGPAAAPEIVLVLATLPPADADRVVRTLIDERLAACANLMAATSTYRWHGAVERADEQLAIFKTRTDRAAALRARLVELHPYEVPEVLVVPVASGLPAYLAWVARESAPGGDD